LRNEPYATGVALKGWVIKAIEGGSSQNGIWRGYNLESYRQQMALSMHHQKIA